MFICFIFIFQIKRGLSYYWCIWKRQPILFGIQDKVKTVIGQSHLFLQHHCCNFFFYNFKPFQAILSISSYFHPVFSISSLFQQVSPVPAISRCVDPVQSIPNHFQQFTAIYIQIEQFQSSSVISSHLQLVSAIPSISHPPSISSHFQTFPAMSSTLQPASHLQPCPAI